MTKILLVEDNEMNKDMLSRRLTKKGSTFAGENCMPFQHPTLAQGFHP